MRAILSAIALCGLVSAVSTTHGNTLSSPVRAAIDAGNQAWIDGVRLGDVARILATYADDAVNCNSVGECISGRPQIEMHMNAQLRSLGHARSASVSSWGATMQGNFVYEWGQAQASYKSGGQLVETYLTVWQKQRDGSWKIFRNLVIPDK